MIINEYEKLSLKKFKIKNLKPDATILILGRRRSGKCIGKGTEILMYDGSIKKVEDINYGDLIMGDDSTARRVLGLNNGIDDLYEILNQKGEKYIVNSEHILSLKYTGKKNLRDRIDRKSYQINWFNKNKVRLDYKTFSYKNKNKELVFNEANEFLNSINDDRYIDIPIKEFLNLSIKYKNNLHGYQVPINFPNKDLEIDPYMIGYWLGDGNTNTSAITTQESYIIKYFKENLGKYNCYLSYRASSDYSYGICTTEKNNNNNYFLSILRKHDLLFNKHIPLNYKCNSRENRLKLLAGFIDADGSYDTGCFEITQSLEHEQLLDDIIYLARSLGFACYKHVKKTSWTHLGVKKEGEALRINISGVGIEEIPTLCPRKKANVRQRDTDVLVSSIKVKKIERGEYYGFELDGNHRFVMGNFIVSHNSFLTRDIFYHHAEIPLGIIFSGTEEANPFFGEFIPDCLIHGDYDPELVDSFIAKQSKKIKKAKDKKLGKKESENKYDGKIPENRGFIVLDDMMNDNDWKKDKTIKTIFFNGRHFNIFFILTMQYPMGIGPELRSNIDYVFIFNEPSIANRKKIYDQYCSNIPSFDHFQNILDYCTQNHECLVVDTAASGDLDNKIFWYKAEAHDNFKVGHPSVWKYHNQHYNNGYDEENNQDKIDAGKLRKKYAKTNKLKIIVSRQGDVQGVDTS